jgi:glycosyltransferase involved in cell wall biosynthesis
MLFSVIIPSFNRLSYLPRTLESVTAQTFRDFEVIVVDDGSTDGTLDYLNSLGSKARIVCQDNLGAGAARNAGAEIARGDYLAFLDSDDVWLPWTLATFAQLIQEAPPAALLSAAVYEFLDDSELGQLRFLSPEFKYFPDYFAASHTGFYIGSGMAVVRRSAFAKAGGFSLVKINAEDHDLALRMGQEPGFIQILQPVTLGWRRHAGGATKHTKQSIEGARYLIARERCGVYPGGRQRSKERREIISRHVRPVALECLKQGRLPEAWQLYYSSFAWQLALRRWKFLFGFPVKAALQRVF